MDKKTNRIENNQVMISGEIASSFTFSHETFGEGFYVMDVRVQRTSGNYDTIPVMVSERLVDVKSDMTRQLARISGQFRSYNRDEEEKKRLILSVFAREIRLEEESDESVKPNYIFLDGFVCKQPIYRKTPLGREIAEILLAVNRAYGKSDYIPCICWGRNAKYAESLEVGTRLKVCGRIQSREYQKKISDDEYETRTAYEVSVSKLEVVEETEE